MPATITEMRFKVAFSVGCFARVSILVIMEVWAM